MSFPDRFVEVNVPEPKHFSDDQVALLDRHIPVGSRDASQKFVLENRDAFVKLERFYQHPVDGTVVRLTADRGQLDLMRAAFRGSSMDVSEVASSGFGEMHWFTLIHPSGAKASVGVEMT